ncbi:hypothetical protein [Congregibacter litoralis]|uniref:Uncharacterized protein n=1 Tax=Congregibacter litoralis KT71 TaxID=314285 RepID=A4A4S3_9GAMM|nr:hypothetical protein [Congregibacter litoralis]EAQ98794.2 hypothetical protein KT71_09212 [Congregibacter litoralis KT71]
MNVKPIARIFVQTSVFLAVFKGQLVHADVHMAEAAYQVGYGSSRVAYGMQFSGACAERVNIRISITSSRSVEESLDEIAQYARDSAPLLIVRCPRVQTIQAYVQDSPSTLENNYQFTLERKSNWQVSDVSTRHTLFKHLLDAGYLPAIGRAPFHERVFVRFENGRFDGIYGNQLGGHLVANHVEKHFHESSPDRLSHYLVRGYFYEVGNEQADGTCDNALEGYALWGAFDLKIPVIGDYVTITRRPCALQGEDARSEVIAFSDVTPRFLRTNFPGFDLDPFILADDLAGKIAASARISQGQSQDAFLATRVPLLKTDLIQVFAARNSNCSSPRYDAIYRINHERRDDQLSRNGEGYQNFIGQLVQRIAFEQCDTPRSATVDNYRLGDDEYWDSMIFSFQPASQSVFADAKDYQLQSLYESDAAKSYRKWKADNMFGPSCTEGVFCELRAGRYLNAIYRGDDSQIRQMDKLAQDKFRDTADDLFPDSKGNEAFNALFGIKQMVETAHLMRGAANKYMYSYKKWGKTCFVEGAEDKEYSITYPTYIVTDEYGYTEEYGGGTSSAVYSLNPEFFPLRDRIAGASGSADASSATHTLMTRELFFGLEDMKQRYACDSPEVKEFEQQLRRITFQILESPGTLSVAAENRPPEVSATMAEPFSEPERVASSVSVSSIARLMPTSMPVASSGLVSISTNPPRSRSAEERRQDDFSRDSVAAGKSVLQDMFNKVQAEQGLPTASKNGVQQATGSGAQTSSSDKSNAIATMSPAVKQQRMRQELADLQQQYQKEALAMNHRLLQVQQSGSRAELMQVRAEMQQELVALRGEHKKRVQAIMQKYK